MAGLKPQLNPRIVNRGELILGLYDVNQQRLIDNGGSVFIDDRLFIEIKYQTSLLVFSFLLFILMSFVLFFKR